MIIEGNTEMLLFRYNNYNNHDFIGEHATILKDRGYVWMLKVGKRSSIEKIMNIKECGGWLILRSPKADGGRNYLARFTDVYEDEPEDLCYPRYYKDIIDSIDDEESVFLSTPSLQWFKLTYLRTLNEDIAQSIVVSKTDKKIDEVISTTRTAVMFVKNKLPIEVREVEK